MKKRAMRVLCSVLAVVLLAGVMPIEAKAGIDFVENGMRYEIQGISYDYNGVSGVVTISGEGSQSANLYGWYTYYDNSMDRHDWEFTTFNYEEGITYVGGFHAQFSRDPREPFTVNLPQSLERIGTHAFYYVKTLQSIDLPGNLQIIEEAAFEGSGLKEIRVPAGTWISWRAFDKCEELRTVYLEDGVTMSNGSFRNCVNLTSVRLPADLNGVGGFEGCVNLTDIDLPETLAVIEDDAFKNTGISSIEFPDSLICIDNYAFENTNISSVEFPEGLESICVNAFAGTNLTEVTIPESVTYIGEGAFPAGEQFTIYGYRNTQAQWFAERNGNTFVPINDCGIKVSIKDEDVVRRNVNAGTVMDADGSSPEWSFVTQRSFSTQMTVTPEDDHFEDVSLLLRLPQGFSFSPDYIVTENDLYIGKLGEEITVILPTIYPVYLSDLDQTSAYKLSVEISARDSLGEQVQGTKSVGFFEPLEVTSHASNTGSYLNGAEYTFSLDRAIGSGSAYSKGTAELAVLLSAAAYESEAISQFLSQLGFSEIKTVGGKYGYTLAHKRILIDNEIKELVYVICRGENEYGEWWGDVNFGKGAEHQNYSAAAENVGNALYNYCEDNDIFLREPYDRYLIITGYSHGAGVANILANTVNNGWLSEEFSKDNASAYTFATPNVTTDANAGGNGNVFNFVHYQDLYLNTPSMLHYDRYGDTRIFGYDNDAGFGHFTTMYETYGRDFTVNSSYTSIWHYTEQELISARLMVQNPTTNLSYFALASHTFLALRLGESTGGNLGNFTRMPEASAAHDISIYHKAVITDAPAASKEEVMSRLQSLEEKYSKSIMPFYEKVWTIANMCPVNVYIEDLSGNTVAYIENGEAVSTSPHVCVWLADDAKYTSISQEHLNDFTFRIEAYDYGVMTHGIMMPDDEDNYTLYARKNIPLSPGKTYYVRPDGHIDSVDKYAAYTDESAFDTALAQEQIHFTDVHPEHWFHDTVYAAAGAGLIAGGSNNMFMPDGELSWSQAVTFAVRLYQYNHGEYVYGSADQTGTNWYDVYVNYALERGVIAEIPENPNAIITRGEAAVIFAAVLGEAEQVNDVPEGFFPDVPESGDIHDAAMALSRAGICNGVSGGLFGVDAVFHRSEVATIVARMAGLVPKAEIHA